MPGAGLMLPAGDARRRPRHHVHAADHLPRAAVGRRRAGRLFVGMLVLIGPWPSILIIVEPYRMSRLTGFLNQPGSQLTVELRRASRASTRFGSGGWFGVGLGASGGRSGASCPNPTTDFIFAIIGEELGLVGTLCVLGLYGGLAYRRAADRPPGRRTRSCGSPRPASRPGSSCRRSVNIGAVIGVLPITGVPLPLVSDGLSPCWSTLVGAGHAASRSPSGAGGAARLWPLVAPAGRSRSKLARPVEAGLDQIRGAAGIADKLAGQDRRRPSMRVLSWPAAGPPDTSNQRSPWPTRCAGSIPAPR